MLIDQRSLECVFDTLQHGLRFFLGQRGDEADVVLICQQGMQGGFRNKKILSGQRTQIVKAIDKENVRKYTLKEM